MKKSILLFLMCFFITNTLIYAQSIIKEPLLITNYERPSPPVNCQKICPLKYFVDDCFEEDFNSFTNYNYYNAYSAYNKTSCSCINSIRSTPINTSLTGNEDEDVTLVTGFDEIVSHLTQSGSDDTNPYGNPIGLTLNRHNGGNKGLRLNTVPDKINIYSEQEFANVSIYTIDFKSQDITNVSFDFATVFEYWDKNDHNHPYFKASIIALKDCDNETVIDSRCVNPESSLVPFQQLNKPPPNNITNPDPYYIDKIRYSNWATMSFDIPTAYLNKRLQLRLEVGDCDGENVVGGFTSLHAGYAYIDNIITCEDTPPPPPDPVCPPASCLNIVEVENCVDYQVWMNCNDPTIDYIDWYYTISGSYVHQYAGTSNGNPAGQHAYPIYLPSPPAFPGTWDNYNLYVYANVVFDDGTECDEIYTYITLDCSGNGNGGNQRIKLSPNPSNDNSELTITGLDVKDIDYLEVFDLYGNSKLKLKPKSNSFNIQSLKPGIYIVKFNTVNGIEQKKIIIE